MNQITVVESKRKRTRSNPVRKWTPAEEKLLINFLLENRDFERPTAQHFYRRFVAKNSIQIDWKLVRSKVRNIRVAYNKAKAWKESTEAQNMESQAFKVTLLKLCTFFDELDDIFGNRIMKCAVTNDSFNSFLNTSEISLDNSEIKTEVNTESRSCSPSVETPLESFNGFLNSAEISLDNSEIKTEENTESRSCSTPLVTPLESSPVDNLPNNRRGMYSRTVVSEILQFQTDMLQLKKEKLDLEKERLREELNMKEKELALKEAELKSQEKIKILELEMKERLAMQELKLKYKK